MDPKNVIRDTERAGDSFSCESLLNAFSLCGFGALLLDEAGLVVDINTEAEKLLADTGISIGEPLPAILRPLAAGQYTEKSGTFLRLGYDRYLLSIAVLQPAELCAQEQILVFRDAGDTYLQRMLLDAVNKMNEALIICDEEDLIYFCNNSLLRMDSLVADDVIGQNVNDVYDMEGGKECKIPQVRREKKSHLNHRQYYSTKYGKKITTVSSTYPVLDHNRVIGTYNLLEDWSTAGTLQREIYELQEKLLQQQGKRKKGRPPIASAKYHFRDIQYNSDVMRTAIGYCEMASQTDASVLIYGETGTGKELFAQSIHNESHRAAGPFLAINCAAIPASLLESTLFGTVKGAFTGADDHIGLFEQANGGTLLLDELNSMDIFLQAKLLRVLQEGTVRRVGGNQEIELDVRIIANINVPPQEAIKTGKLRQDLYFRLATVYVAIPPLRERGRDIFLLTQNFISSIDKELMKNVRDLSPETKMIFTGYHWPGNVRELQHCITHAMSIIPYEESYITPEYLPEHIWKPEGRNVLSSSRYSFPAFRSQMPAASRNNTGYSSGAGSVNSSPDRSVSPGETDFSASPNIQGFVGNFERETILNALYENEGNISKAGAMLGISRQSLQYRIRKYKIDIATIKKESR